MSHRNTFLTTATLTLALTTVGLFGVQSVGGAASGPGQGTMSGTYLGTTDAFGFPLAILTTFHADGTITSTDQTDQGLGGAGLLNNPAHGIWYNSGPNETTTTLMELLFDLNGVPVPGCSIHRVTVVVEWNAGHTVGSGAFGSRCYDPLLGQDPLDPEDGNVNFPPESLPITLRKITQ